jgi:gas vesicle protein
MDGRVMTDLAGFLGGIGALVGAIVAAVALLVNARTTRQNLEAQQESTRQQLDSQERQHREALSAQREMLAVQRLWGAQLPLSERLTGAARDTALLAEAVAGLRTKGLAGATVVKMGIMMALWQNSGRAIKVGSVTLAQAPERFKYLRNQLQDMKALCLVLAPERAIEPVEKLLGTTAILAEQPLSDDALRAASQAANEVIEQVRSVIPGNN